MQTNQRNVAHYLPRFTSLNIARLTFLIFRIQKKFKFYTH